MLLQLLLGQPAAHLPVLLAVLPVLRPLAAVLTCLDLAAGPLVELPAALSPAPQPARQQQHHQQQQHLPQNSLTWSHLLLFLPLLLLPLVQLPQQPAYSLLRRPSGRTTCLPPPPQQQQTRNWPSCRWEHWHLKHLCLEHLQPEHPRLEHLQVDHQQLGRWMRVPLQVLQRPAWLQALYSNENAEMRCRTRDGE